MKFNKVSKLRILGFESWPTQYVIEEYFFSGIVIEYAIDYEKRRWEIDWPERPLRTTCSTAML
jgi:hypothetical protein